MSQGEGFRKEMVMCICGGGEVRRQFPDTKVKMGEVPRFLKDSE